MKNIQYIIFSLPIIFISHPVISATQISDNPQISDSLSVDNMNVIMPLDSIILDSVSSDSTEKKKVGTIGGTNQILCGYCAGQQGEQQNIFRGECESCISKHDSRGGKNPNRSG